MKTTVTVKEAAEMMSVSKPTIRKLVREGKLGGYNVGRKLLINILSIPAFMRKGKEL